MSRRKESREGSSSGGLGWMVTFADLMTLLLTIPDCCPCKDVGFYRVPFNQPDDLRRSFFKIKSDLSPLVVVVRLIQVDSGGGGEIGSDPFPAHIFTVGCQK